MLALRYALTEIRSEGRVNQHRDFATLKLLSIQAESASRRVQSIREYLELWDTEILWRRRGLDIHVLMRARAELENCAPALAALVQALENMPNQENETGRRRRERGRGESVAGEGVGV